MRPAAYLDELGLLGPSARVLAHGVWLDEAELELIAERGATVVTNPAANMKLAVGGVLPLSRRRPRPGSAIGLGTDGVSSNSNLDSFEEVKLLRALPRSTPAATPRRCPPPRPWRSPAGCARRCWAERRWRSGSPPTSCCCAASDPELSAGDLDADLVYAAGGSVVDTTVVAGPGPDARTGRSPAPTRSSPRCARGPRASPPIG